MKRCTECGMRTDTHGDIHLTERGYAVTMTHWAKSEEVGDLRAVVLRVSWWLCAPRRWWTSRKFWKRQAKAWRDIAPR